jgi:hypothetical protein
VNKNRDWAANTELQQILAQEPARDASKKWKSDGGLCWRRNHSKNRKIQAGAERENRDGEISTQQETGKRIRHEQANPEQEIERQSGKTAGAGTEVRAGETGWRAGWNWKSRLASRTATEKSSAKKNVHAGPGGLCLAPNKIGKPLNTDTKPNGGQTRRTKSSHTGSAKSKKGANKQHTWYLKINFFIKIQQNYNWIIEVTVISSLFHY